MDEQDRGLELKVGLFVAVGFCILAALVVQFGRLGEGFKSYYSLTIHFADASGLLKGSDVLMGGAKIGQVSGQPRLVRNERGVDVPLRIYEYAHIPTGTSFTVGSSGLLGDRFVQVMPPPGQPKSYIAKDSRVEGAREKGISDLTQQASALVKDLRGAVGKVDIAVSRLNEQALSQANMNHLHETFANLSKTSASLSQSAQKIDGVIAKADSTMGSAKAAAETVKLAAGDARETIQGAGKVMKEATSGNGPLALLLTDKEMAQNLRALILNLRSHGILFYRDTAARAPAPEPSPPLRRRDR